MIFRHSATGQCTGPLHAGEELPATPYVALQVPTAHSGLEVTDEVLVKAAHACGIAVHVWTVNDESEMERLVDLGVDGIISDLPTQLAALLADRGVSWRP